jgi:putative ubiquitin-RnfH superfamily antitoxin RatB of RatAB toxin-antitoxin module
MGNLTLKVEVGYALPEQQVIKVLELPAGSTVGDAIYVSGLLEQFPEITKTTLIAGVFGKVCSLEQVLNAFDRVEIYRPLIHDPKEARRQRAKK